MRKIRLSDTDVEFFDLEISPSEYMFYQKHKDAFRTMWLEQDKPFWTRFVITFRSYTVKIGVMKQMSINSPTFENFIDQAFIFIHEQFVDGKVNMAKTFLEDVAKLAQNQDKLPFLDSKSFARDPFYLRDTRDLFRRFFGPPDQKSSYVKVYILCPVYLRFGGSVCRCLTKWIDSPPMSPLDDSYWVPPSPHTEKPIRNTSCHGGSHMCTNCMDDCGTKYFKEKICGGPDGPKFLDFWQLGDPRFNDTENPLYDLKANRLSDWRDDVSVEQFRAFFQYAKFKYGKEMDQCKECSDLRQNPGKMFRVCQDSTHKKKKKKKKNKKQKEKEAEKLEDLTEEQLSERLMEIVKRNTSLEGAYMEAKELRNKINIIDSPKKSIETVSSEKAEKIDEAQIERGVFTSKAKVSDDFKCVMSRYEEGSKSNVISGFKIMKMEEESTGAKETTVKVVTRVTQEDMDRKPKESEYPLNARMIRNKIEGLPEKLEWWEGVGWCIAVVNYEHEEKGLFRPPSNFTLKVTSSSEDAMKRTMLKLLYYVAKRKKRYSPGWCMDEDDIVACVLPDDSPDLAGLAVTIQKGFRFEERLTDEEKKTKTQRPYVGRKVLMTLEPGSAAKMLQMDGGHENLRDLIDRVMEESGYQDDEGDKVLPLHPGTTLYIPGKGGTPILDVSGNRPKDMHAESMWDQLLGNPEKFELFLMVDEDKVPEFKKHGLKIVDAETIWQSVCKTGERSCAYCNKQLESCKCFGDKSRLDKKKDEKEEANQKTEKMEERKPFQSVKKEAKKEVTLVDTSKAENEIKTTFAAFKATVKEENAVEVTQLKTTNNLNVSKEANLKTADSKANEEKAVKMSPLKTSDSLNFSEKANLKTADFKATVEEETAVGATQVKTSDGLNVSEEANLKRARPMVNVDLVQDSSPLSQPSAEKGKELEPAPQNFKDEAEEKGENLVREQQKVKNEEEQTAMEEILFMEGEQTSDKALSSIAVEREKGSSFSSSKIVIISADEFQMVQSSGAIPLLAKTGMETSCSNVDSGVQSITLNEKSPGAEDTIPKIDTILTNQSTDKEEKVNKGIDWSDTVQEQDGKKDSPSGIFNTDNAVNLEKSINDIKTGQTKHISMAQGALDLVVDTSNISLPKHKIQDGQTSPKSISLTSTTNSLTSSEMEITSATLKDNKMQNKNCSVDKILLGGSSVDKVPVPPEGTNVVKSSATNTQSSEPPKKPIPPTETKRNTDPKLTLPKGFRVHLNVVGDSGYKSKLEEMLEPYFAEKSTTIRQVLPNGTVITQMVYQSTFESEDDSQNKSENTESQKTESDEQTQKTANITTKSGSPSTIVKDHTAESVQENNVVKQKEKDEASGKEMGQKTEISLQKKDGVETAVKTNSSTRISPNGNIMGAKESENKQNRNSQGAAGIEKQEISTSKDKEAPFTEITKNGLRTCYNCKKQEPKRKMFKKCQKCKEENVRFARYYCKRECQVEDWNKRHKREHKEKLLEMAFKAQ
ncbi:hypothetical protein CHS0354_021683 [Potamilus streckersoni]|uniref:MYND-type domain-containing protein n=1 Tax=Potamilus streckersoni TaxID=2493646 RepID=A0AAE0TMH6_9BIVA|nr:hypothetical protein CHS0354_021683 [Potamilus streckersoni]